MTNKKLRKIMIDRDVLTYDLAKATNVTPVQVSRIVNCKSKGSMKWWGKAAEFLKCNLSDILED